MEELVTKKGTLFNNADVAVDGNSNVYLCGTTNSTNNIAAGGFLNTYSGSTGAAFLVKFDSSGTRLWGTYYIGTTTEAYGLLQI